MRNSTPTQEVTPDGHSSECAHNADSRAGLVRRVNAGELAKTVAAGVGVCDKTVRKWAGRFSREGAAGLVDRSSRPHRLRCPTAPEVAEQVIALRRQRLLMKHIAAQLELSIATVSRLLKRVGLSRLSALSPPPPVQRYEYSVRRLPHPRHQEARPLPAGRLAHNRHSPKAQPGVLALRSPTFVSMTIHAWPTWKFCPTSARKPPPASSCAPSITSRPWGSGFCAHHD